MRVIEQLIRHFWDRGQISREEVDRLIALGFVNSRELVGYWPEFAEEAAETTGDEGEEMAARLADAIAEELIAHSSDKPRGRRVAGRRWGRQGRRPLR